MMNLNITYQDIEKRLRSFSLDDVDSDIDDLVTAETAIVEVAVVQIGVDPDLVSASRHARIYHVCRLIVMFRVTSSVMIDFSHEWSFAARQRNDRADKLEQLMLNQPESFIDDWNEHDYLGSWGYSSDSENQQLRTICSWVGVPWSRMMGA